MFTFFWGILSVVLGIKLVLFLVHLLLAKFGRNIGLGTKWTPDKGEYAMIVGASGAVGSEYAREFASMGFNLLLISRNAAKLEKLAAEFKEKYKIKDIKVLSVDFFQPSSIETVRQTVKGVEDIVALVNCMGGSYPPKKFAEYPLSYNHDMINMAVITPVLMIEMVLPKMLEKGKGAIINYNSMAGRFKFPLFSTFSACKAFMATFSDILSVEYAGDGITVQNVEPFLVTSYMTSLLPGALAVPPCISVFSSFREVGIEPSTYGYWSHKLVALLLHTLVFVFGSRLTSKMVGFILLTFFGQYIEKPDDSLSASTPATKTTTSAQQQPAGKGALPPPKEGTSGKTLQPVGSVGAKKEKSGTLKEETDSSEDD
ncbi:hypothetical protein TYRP_005969 [Tyrophagus putrescentiae]|nr:hypothetical protein TYRP_005969 [Tyrophagus putrescentiae]